MYQPYDRKSGPSCEPDPLQSRTHLTSTDRLRLDVAMATNVEMYSWVGESRFDDRDLLDMVSEGAISSGSFGSYLTALFRTDAASFTYHEDLTRDGRAFYEFGFRVPREKSRYLYGKGKHQVLTGYDGTLLVDPSTAELVQLTIRTNGLLLETAACYVTSTLDYSRVNLKGVDFLLPSASVLRIAGTNGDVLENHTVFANCHEFLGEATLKFETPDEVAGADANHPKGKKIPTIPAGASFVAALTSAVDTTTAAAGDPLQAKLITPIKDGFKVLVPAGAPVSARIVRLEHFHTDPATVSLAIKAGVG